MSDQAAHLSRWKLGLLAGAVAAVALPPWCRNHAFLRDFYDYGLFINVNARLDAGQRLFADFTTPAQSATFALNHLAERLGGGTYVGMTWGAAALIVTCAVFLTVLLARRLPAVLAGLLASAIIACSASQHTIIFYNPLGVLEMALVVWTFALTPFYRREEAGWYILAAAGLVLGGLNKINFHLLSCAFALGWVVWGAVTSNISLRRMLGTVGFVLGFGIIVPLVIELAWTGVDIRTWYYNVVQLPLGARGGRIGLLLDAKVFLSTLHDYYGPLRLPRSGLVVLALPLIAVGAAWICAPRERAWLHRIFALLAGLCGVLASAALLLTNNEIVYLTVASSLVMLVGLWLGFRLPTRGVWPWIALGLPGVLVGACGWESAWLGQRSQFGHASDSRSAYVRGETIGPAFRYLRGLGIPPGIARSLGDFAVYRDKLGKEANQVFYGPGIEWLERIWPAPKIRGLPLVAAAFDGERELELLKKEVIFGGPYRHILVVEAWNSWHPSVEQAFFQGFTMERLGPGLFVYHKQRAGVLWARPVNFDENIGGNVASTRLVSNMPMRLLADGRRFVGVDHGSGEIEIDAPSFRASGQAVLQRVKPSSGQVAHARFEVYALEGNSRYRRWAKDVILPDGVNELEVSTGQVDGSGLNLAFTATIAEGEEGRVVAGWREPRLWNTVEGGEEPVLLQQGVVQPIVADASFIAALLPDELRQTKVFTRDAWQRDGACWLAPGGEIWIRLTGILSKIDLEIRAPTSPTGTRPQVRVVYYKGGRLEPFHPVFDDANNTARYSAWSAESGGWLVVLADPHRSCPLIAVKVGKVERP